MRDLKKVVVMFPGDFPFVDLVERDPHKVITRHAVWWVIGLVLLVVFFPVQRYVVASVYQPDIEQLQQQIKINLKQTNGLHQKIQNFPEILPEQHQQRHAKLAILLQLLQEHMPDNVRVTAINWYGALHIEGESHTRDTISPIRKALMKTGYFSSITLEQIHKSHELFSFSLLVVFSERLNASHFTKSTI